MLALVEDKIWYWHTLWSFGTSWRFDRDIWTEQPPESQRCAWSTVG